MCFAEIMQKSAKVQKEKECAPVYINDWEVTVNILFYIGGVMQCLLVLLHGTQHTYDRTSKQTLYL